MQTAYNLRNLKIVKAMSAETLCFTADIYNGNDLVGHALNRGHGGCNQYNFLSVELANAAHAHAKSVDPDPSKYVDSLDVLVDHLVLLADTRKQVERDCKTKTCFTLRGDTGNGYRMIKAPYSPAVQKHLDDKYGAKIDMVLNQDINAAVAMLCAEDA